jgi:ribonuclease Z
VYEANGVAVTAFLVDHGQVKPAFGYRIDYQGRSLVISGDTKPSENLVKHSQGVDLLIHELGRWKDDPMMTGAPDELLPNSRQTRDQSGRSPRTTPTAPKRAGCSSGPSRSWPCFHTTTSHPRPPAARATELQRPVEFGEDLMTIDIGEDVIVHRSCRPLDNPEINRPDQGEDGHDGSD